MLSTRLPYLFAQYEAGVQSDAEYRELLSILSDEDQREDITQWLAGEISTTNGSSIDPSQWDAMIGQILANNENAPAFIVPMRKKAWRVWVAAAAVIAVCVFGTMLWMKQQQPDNTKPGNQVAVTDVKAPATNRATITLANGKQVFLDEVGIGSLAQQGNVEVVKLADGKVGYRWASGGSVLASRQHEQGTNTLTNPRGSQVIDITLSDGSRVWLNAGSSITYPVAFAGVERKVEMSGEAYFEVTHNAAMPFVVAKNEMQVQVLGTHFNVNAYDDEDDIKVTLLEGSVQVQDPRATKIIKPGEQARVNNGIQVMRGVDLAGVMAWKNGFFQFNGMGIQGVMRQLERWYDVEARYEGRIPERQFAGQIDRHANLSEVLTILKESKVNVKLEGKTLIVRP